MMPTNVAARMTLAADPGSLQGAVAAGILGCGPVILGTAEACARLLERGAASVARGGGPRRGRGRRVAREIHAAGERAARLRPSGAPPARPARRADPRAGRRARRERAARRSSRARFREAVAEAWGKPLTMNVSMPIAAVMLDLGFPAAAVKAVPILARTAGLLAHLAEEQRAADRLPDGRGGRGGDRATSRRGGALMLEPEVETRPWDGAARRWTTRLPRAARLPARALAVLPREARGCRGPPRQPGGLAEIAPAAADREAGAPGDRARAENPIGAHLCVDRPEIVRIYSTSGTTGTPELHPADRGRPRQLGRPARRAATRASGVAAGPAHRLDLQRRAVRGRRGARLVRPHRPLPHPGRHRQHRAADARDRAAASRRRRC